MLIDDLTDEWLISRCNYIVSQLRVPAGWRDDARQTAYLTAFSIRQRLRDSGVVGREISRRNLVLSLWRDVLAAVRREQTHEHEADCADWTPAREPTGAMLDEMEMLRRVRRRISNQQRELICRCFVRGESIRHISRELGLPRSTVHHHVQKALQRMRTQMSGVR